MAPDQLLPPAGSTAAPTVADPTAVDPSLADPSTVGTTVPPLTSDPAQVFPDPSLPPAGVGVPETTTPDPLAGLADGVHQAVGDALDALARVWGAGTATVDEGAVTVVSGPLTWYLGAAAVTSVLIAGGRMAWQRRGQPMTDLGRGLGTLVLVSSAGLAAVSLAVAAADGFSHWVLGRATDDLGASLSGLLATEGTAGLTPVLGVLVDSAAVLTIAAQVLLLVGRLAAVVVLTGVLPLTASAMNTETGRTAFTRATAWLAALVLVQPAAALVLAVSFRVAPAAPGGSDPLVRSLTGVALLVLVLSCLPALLRLLSPAVATVMARGGAGTRADGGTVPSGARPLPAGAVGTLHARAAATRLLSEPAGSPAPAGPPPPSVTGPVLGRGGTEDDLLRPPRPGSRAEMTR